MYVINMCKLNVLCHHLYINPVLHIHMLLTTSPATIFIVHNYHCDTKINTNTYILHKFFYIDLYYMLV